jgi:hypothetical protein
MINKNSLNEFECLNDICQEQIGHNLTLNSFTNQNSQIFYLISELINQIINLESYIESWRFKLSKINTFNPRRLFEKILVKDETNSSESYTIGPSHFRSFFTNYNISSYDSDILFNRFDKGKNNLVGFSKVLY